MSRSLDSLKPGEKAVISDLAGQPEFISRAAAIGFSPASDVTVIRNSRGYPLIVYLNDTQVIVDRSEAKKVLIDER